MLSRVNAQLGFQVLRLAFGELLPVLGFKAHRKECNMYLACPQFCFRNEAEVDSLNHLDGCSLGHSMSHSPPIEAAIFGPSRDKPTLIQGFPLAKVGMQMADPY